MTRSKNFTIATGPDAAMAVGGFVRRAAGSVTTFTDLEVASFVRFFSNSPEQMRDKAALRCDPILMRVAQAKALDMAERKYVAHVDLGGFGMNHYVRQAGYALPSTYGSNSGDNQIESICAGAMTGERVWQIWMESIKHKTHLTGSDGGKFFKEQTDFGVGRVAIQDSAYTYYWVFLSARPAR